MKTLPIILITAVLAAGGTWLLTSRHTPAAVATGSAEAAPDHYQCSMHPQVKSDKPGRCTICGMELTPMFPGGSGHAGAAGKDVVSLSATQVQVLDVRTATAEIRPLVRTLRIAGTIDDDERRHRLISAYVDGRVEKLYANHHGAEVTAGEPLALIYSPGLLQAEREYRQLTGELKRNTGLRLQQMGLTAGQVEALADKDPAQLTSEILAPLTGTVVAHDVYEGQYVTTGGKMFEIADFSIMWFMMEVYEQDLPWIEIGQTVIVTTPSRPGKTHEGKITFIDPNLNEATRTTQVRVELPNPLVDGRRGLLHKLYAEGDVQVESAGTLTVPRTAVIESGPQAVAYLDLGDGAYRQTPVKLGRRGDALVEILAGLRAGDQVVTNGNLLIDGQAELNRSFMPAEAAAVEGEVSPAQQKVIHDFLQTADAMAAALAADDLARFNTAGEPAMEKTAALVAAVSELPIPQAQRTALTSSSHFHGSADLKSARADFLKFSMAATDVLGLLRNVKGFPELQIWQCPMVDQAIPGAAAEGRWIQTGDRKIQNPYFGAEMLECGEPFNP